MNCFPSISEIFSRWSKTRGAPFVLLVLLEAVFVFGVILLHRLVGAHDGFQYMSLQYYFFNNMVTASEIPWWIPYVGHGTVANWQFLFQAGLLQTLLLPAAPLLKGLGFFPLFVAGMFVDECLLMAGVWLLSKRFFKLASTRFYVTASAAGSCLWAYQPWFNFHAFYLLPLCLYFLHRFREERKTLFLFLAGNLLVLQNCGSLPYLLPVNMLFVAVYFGSDILFEKGRPSRSIKSVLLNPKMLLVLAGVAFTALPLFLLIRSGMEQVVLNALGRGPGLEVVADRIAVRPVSAFGYDAFDLLTGFMTHLNYTLYFGLTGAPFIILSLILGWRNRKSWAFLVTALFFSLVPYSAIALKSLHTVWPLMRYFRHFNLLVVFVKVPLWFLAGFGFESFVSSFASRKKNVRTTVGLVLFGFFLLMGLILTGSLQDQAFFRHIGTFPDRILQKQFGPGILSFWLASSGVFSFIFAGIFLLFIVIRNPRLRPALIFFMVLAHVANIYSHKIRLSKIIMTPFSEDRYRVFAFEPLPYRLRRQMIPSGKNRRWQALQHLSSPSFHCMVNAFIFEDQLGCSYRVDYWHKGLDRLMRRYWGQDISDTGQRLKGVDAFGRIVFPLGKNPAAGRMAGFTADKIQFFGAAYTLGEAEDVYDVVTSPGYQGLSLFVDEPRKTKTIRAPLREWPGGDDFFQKDFSLNIPYRVLSFSSNRIVVETDLPGNTGGWMFYSDNWHLEWQATVNGQKVPVLLANGAYKAVPLHAGKNRVEMIFRSRTFSTAVILIWINILALLILLAVHSARRAGFWAAPWAGE